jgi:YVTN family beta-propeller protein
VQHASAGPRSVLRTIATVHVGRLPEAVAVTPDGRQVRVGNDLSGDITVINPATNTVTTTISGGSGTATLLAGPLGIAFTKAG